MGLLGHKILELFAYTSLNMHAQLSSGATPKESSNAYTFVLAFSGKLEFQIKKYFGIH